MHAEPSNEIFILTVVCDLFWPQVTAEWSAQSRLDILPFISAYRYFSRSALCCGPSAGIGEQVMRGREDILQMTLRLLHIWCARAFFLSSFRVAKLTLNC